MTRLQDLYDIGGQSPWLDNLRRDWLEDGQLAELVSRSASAGSPRTPPSSPTPSAGRTPTTTSSRALMKDHTVESAYWELAITDIQHALELLRPVYDESDGEDGFVSLEVSPALAHDTEATCKTPAGCTSASPSPTCWSRCPATNEGVPAIKTMISEGRSINVTLIFGIDRYDEVIEAYISGLEALVAAGREAELARRGQRGLVLRQPGRHRGRPPSRDVGRAARRATPPSSACGARPRWPRPRWPTSTSTAPSPATAGRRCGRRGARVQRPLWASTSTKNPGYPDLLYVD